MSKIQIDNLQAAGSEFFESNESFLTELQAVEAHAVYGGKKSNKSSNKRSNKSSNRNSGRSTIVIIPFPIFTGFHCR